MLKAYVYEGVSKWSIYGYNATSECETRNYYLNNPIMILEVEEFTYSDKLNEITQFDLNFNINSLDIDYFPIEKFKNYYVEVFYGSEMLKSGLIYEFETDLVTGETKISCNDPLFMLNYIPAIPNAIVNNRSTIGHLQTILENTQASKHAMAAGLGTGWVYSPFRIVRFATIDDWDVLTSVDLRGEKQLYSQLQKVLKSTRNLFVKYSGTKFYITRDPVNSTCTGYGVSHLIDIGNFSYDVNFQLDNSNIKSMSVNKQIQPKVTLINPYGGEYTLSGVKNQLIVSDKQMYFKELPDITHSSILGQEPYVQLTDYISDFENISGLVEYFTDIQPDPVDNPTATEIRRAAQSLYLKSARQIRAKEKQDEITIETNDFPINLEAGNKVNFQYQYIKEYYNKINNTLERKTIESLSYENANYYIREIEKSFKSSGERSAKITLHPKPEYHEVESEAKEVALARKLKTDGEIFAVATPKITLGYYEFTIQNVVSNITIYGIDCYYFDVNKLTNVQLGDQNTTPINSTPINWFTIDSTSISKNVSYDVWEKGVYTIEDDTYLLFMDDTYYPKANSSTFRIYVSKNNNWTINDSITVKVLVFFEL